MFKQQKGITLIALVITIIVLLILAGITIAMLTGSDSAPAKANEAKQKQDIGSVKDQLYIAAQNAQLDYYNETYVVAGSVGGTAQSSEASKTQVGTEVASAVQNNRGTPKNTDGIASGNGIGDAKVYYGTTTVASGATRNKACTITIVTRDFHVNGYVEQKGGALKWGAITDNGSTAISAAVAQEDTLDTFGN